MSSETRAILALSFEPSDTGFVYYHRRWSRGVPVTADERAAYLRFSVMRSRKAWRAALIGRPTVPPRPFLPTYWKLLATMPISAIIGALLIGFSLAAVGMIDLQTVAGLLQLGLGLFLVTFGIQVIWAKYVTRKKPA